MSAGANALYVTDQALYDGEVAVYGFSDFGYMAYWVYDSSYDPDRRRRRLRQEREQLREGLGRLVRYEPPVYAKPAVPKIRESGLPLGPSKTKLVEFGLHRHARQRGR